MKDRSALISKLINSRKFREAYIRAKLSVLIPSQVRALRLKWPMTQPELGHEAEMKQSRISAIERPGSANLNVDTLIRVAAALRVGLKVELVPFSEMVRWENSFSQDRFNLPKIEDDDAFINPDEPTTDEGSRRGSVVYAFVKAAKQPQADPKEFTFTQTPLWLVGLTDSGQGIHDLPPSKPAVGEGLPYLVVPGNAERREP